MHVCTYKCCIVRSSPLSFLVVYTVYVHTYIAENQPLPRNDRNLQKGPASKEYVSNVQAVSQGLLLFSQDVVSPCWVRLCVCLPTDAEWILDPNQPLLVRLEPVPLLIYLASCDNNYMSQWVGIACSSAVFFVHSTESTHTVIWTLHQPSSMLHIRTYVLWAMYVYMQYV